MVFPVSSQWGQATTLAPWQTTNVRYWSYPKRIWDELREVHAFAQTIKAKYPELWETSKNANAEKIHENLTQILERGYFLPSDEDFVKRWQAAMKRSRYNRATSGLVTMLKLCGYTVHGFTHMQVQLLGAADQVALTQRTKPHFQDRASARPRRVS
ncbi:hypothetical protein SAMN05421823_11927 [Catalinimonas alkaloidigena]|uniref:Uncharacterized protein n=1 Tax=Catalinimonas alkaloidigena TaxID=1075417 RepID=A0A1G9V688_9BACT|nr:hypothetical protein [Catalinimonas alkaloidigena]SDM67600.1 hypothetical protein SAMN05421823_11927 [Catalinimonas alkaloidigena]